MAAVETLRLLRAYDDLAQALGQDLGRREILFRCVPSHATGGTAVISLRSLVVVLGDQLDVDSSAFDGFDAARDAVWMAEVQEESTHVWSAKQRTAIFLSAMRHFADALRGLGRTVHYTRLGDADNRGTLADELRTALGRLKPELIILTAPGDWRVLKDLRQAAAGLKVPLELRDDRHFFCTVRDFAAHARGRKTLRLEYFYRQLRKKHDVLMDGDQPVGGRWNYDEENRASLSAADVLGVPSRRGFAPDPLTHEVIALVNDRFTNHPGTLDSFAWPVTREQALAALTAFVEERLPDFGRFQDAMWQGEAWLYHSHLSSALNLKLLNPREVVRCAEAAYRRGHAPLAAVEGFIRQILGWREYVRGVYWTRMPDYAQLNELQAMQALPPFYWNAETDMACLHDAIDHTLHNGYAHHIQRLMVTGLFALLLGVRPQFVHEWYLAVYVDAVEWAEMPNVLGMSQYADAGLMASKPYIATGKYIDRMSNACAGCRYDPALREGDRACPFTTLYWDFLMRHETRLAANARLSLQVRNLQRLSGAQKEAIAARAAAIRRGEVGGRGAVPASE